MLVEARARGLGVRTARAGAAALLGAIAWSSSLRAQEPPSSDACLASYEISQRLRLEKKLTAARTQLITCSKSECPDVLRRDCTKWLGEVDAALPSVVVVAHAGSREVTDVQVIVDGTILAESLDGTALTLDPGRHVFRFERDGLAPVEKTLLVREGEKSRRLEVTFDTGSEPTQAEPTRWPVYGLAAFGAIGLGSFAFFGLRAHSRKEDLEQCKGHCPEDDVDEVRRDQLVADVSLGVGLVALGAAAYLHFGSAPERKPTDAGWKLGLTPLSRGGGAHLSASF